MKAGFKKAFLWLIFFGNLCCIFLLLMGNAATLLNPARWWPVAFAGILFPLLLITTLLFALFWLFMQSKKALYSSAAILLSIPHIISTFAFNFPSAFHQAKEPRNVRIITWNVGLMNYTAGDSATASTNNKFIFKQLQEADADIICLQEFFTAVTPGKQYNFLDSISRTLNYPYHYFSRDNAKFNASFFSGSIIFSRYKIIDTLKIVFPKPFEGSIIKAGILINNDTIDIFTTRLQPFRFQSNEYKELHDIKSGSDAGFTGSKNIISKLRLAYKLKAEQVLLAKNLIAESKRPKIFTGDLNDVPVSFAYSELKNEMADVWISKGKGLGRTFKFISPTLRIDDIFYNHYFKASQVTRIMADKASDHNGVVADLLLIKKEQ
ncbi:MAG: endonuclease/exonuclease/phosphatase family protein [Ferruginibacter sp.]